MKNPSDLRLLALAVLQHRPKATLSRYQIMTNINHIIGYILPPYSPGAVYHELKLLEKEQMINFNQELRVTIAEHGLDYLHHSLLETPLPAPLLSRLARILAALLLSDESKKATVLRKVQIEMIKNNQLLPKNKRRAKTKEDETENELSFLGYSLNQSVSAFIAQL